MDIRRKHMNEKKEIKERKKYGIQRQSNRRVGSPVV